MQGRDPLGDQIGVESVLTGIQSVAQLGGSHPAKAGHQVRAFKPERHVLIQPALCERLGHPFDKVDRGSLRNRESSHNKGILHKKNRETGLASRFPTSSPPGGRIRADPNRHIANLNPLESVDTSAFGPSGEAPFIAQTSAIRFLSSVASTRLASNSSPA